VPLYDGDENVRSVPLTTNPAAASVIAGK